MTYRGFCMLMAGLLGVMSGAAQAQPVNPSLRPADGIPSNFVQVLQAEGDSLWIGPQLHLTTDSGESFSVAEADSLFGSRNQVFALDVEGALLWAGLAFGTGNGGSGAGGFVFSTDGGETFTYRFPPLDGLADTTVSYGANTLTALPITAEESSAPTGIDVVRSSGVVWSANGIGGIRRSADQGQSWQRVVLPPDTLDAIYPDTSYSFFVGPPEQNRGWLNHFAQSTLVDETGTVWVGTAAGINRSRPEDVQPNGRIWQRFSFNDSPSSLVGDFVAAIEEQPLPDRRNPIWIASLGVNQQGQPRQNNGITVTRDGGETFKQVLVGEPINAIAFGNGQVFAAGDRGLFISDNDGRTWTSVTDFELANENDFVKSNVEAISVATTATAVWVGTTDGLLRRPYGAERWSLFRADVPVNPETPNESVPDVSTYAYPNPFSPPDDRVVRIRYELDTAMDVEVRIFDFSMNLVRRIVDTGQPAGQQETTWDGKDASGLRVANGPYFYVVDTGDETVRGKILVMR